MLKMSPISDFYDEQNKNSPLCLMDAVLDGCLFSAAVLIGAVWQIAADGCLF